MGEVVLAILIYFVIPLILLDLFHKSIFILSLLCNIINLFVTKEKSVKAMFTLNCIVLITCCCLSCLTVWICSARNDFPKLIDVHYEYITFACIFSLAGMLYYLFMQRKNKFLFTPKKESTEPEENPAKNEQKNI